MDTSLVILIAILAGVIGIALSYFIGKAVGMSSQREEVGNLQSWVAWYQNREEVLQKGMRVEATLEHPFKWKPGEEAGTLEYEIAAYWDTYRFTGKFPVDANSSDVTLILSQALSVTVFVIFTDDPENPLYRMIRPW